MSGESAINPYAPPKANVVDVPAEVATIEAFPRFSTWWVLLLAILTFGVYPLYWLYARTKILNRVVPANPIPMGLAVAAVALFLLNLAGGVLDGIYAEQLAIGVRRTFTAVAWISVVVNLVWVFKFRNRLNERFMSHKGDCYWLGPLLTFFFQVLYLQYKLNQLIDRERTATSLGGLAQGVAAQRALAGGQGTRATAGEWR